MPRVCVFSSAEGIRGHIRGRVGLCPLHLSRALAGVPASRCAAFWARPFPGPSVRGKASPTTECIPIPSCPPTGLHPHPASCPQAACLVAGNATGRTVATPRPRRRCPSTQVSGAGDREHPARPCPPPVTPADHPAPPPPGPRLYKEPSAKSNKFIIHNALSHCCLAGKVNEPQKNRILEVSPGLAVGAGGLGPGPCRPPPHPR